MKCIWDSITIFFKATALKTWSIILRIVSSIKRKPLEYIFLLLIFIFGYLNWESVLRYFSPVQQSFNSHYQDTITNSTFLYMRTLVSTKKAFLPGEIVDVTMVAQAGDSITLEDFKNGEYVLIADQAKCDEACSGYGPMPERLHKFFAQGFNGPLQKSDDDPNDYIFSGKMHYERPGSYPIRLINLRTNIIYGFFDLEIGSSAETLSMKLNDILLLLTVITVLQSLYAIVKEIFS